MQFKKLKLLSTLSLLALLFACTDSVSSNNSSSLGSSNNSSVQSSTSSGSSSSSSTSKGDSSSSTSSPIDSSTSSGGNSSTSSNNQSSTGGQSTTSNNGQTSSTGGQTTTSGNNQTSTGGQTSSSDPTIEEPSIVEDKSFDDLADASSIDNNHLYKVEGIWLPDGTADDNTIGSGQLVDQKSGESIKIKGMAKDSNNAFSFDSTTRAYSFTNPNNYSEAQLHEGDKLTLVIGVYDSNGYGAYLERKEEDYTNIKYEINISYDGTEEGGSATLDAQENKGYLGQEVTLITAPASYYEVESVKHNGKVISASSLNTYKFNVELPTNNVVVKFVAPTFGVTQDITPVYAQVPSDWTNVHIHYWNDDEDAIEEGYGSVWPGEKMTLVNEEDHLYGFKLPKGVSNVIINNGGDKKTVDLDYSTTKNLIIVGEVGEETDGAYTVKYSSYTPKPEDPELAEKEYSKIDYIQMYFKVVDSWETPYIYYFGTAAPGAPSWPGIQLTPVEGKEHIFTFEKLPTDIAAFIINDGGAQPQQTANLDLYADLDYNINGYEISQGDNGGFNATPCTYGEETGQFNSVTISETNYYVTGNQKSGWGFDPQYRLRHDKASNSASLIVSFEADEEFKVAVEGWTSSFGYSDLQGSFDDFTDAYGNIKTKNTCTYKITVNNINSGDKSISFEKVS